MTRDTERDVVSLPVIGMDGSCRGHVRVARERLAYTEFCITIDTRSFLSPFEAMGFARRLIEAVAIAEAPAITQGESDG